MHLFCLHTVSLLASLCLLSVIYLGLLFEVETHVARQTCHTYNMYAAQKLLFRLLLLIPGKLSFWVLLCVYGIRVHSAE